MRRNLTILLSLILCLITTSACEVDVHLHQEKPALDAASRAWLQRILDSWATVTRVNLRISPKPVPWLIAYDERHAWHLKPPTSLHRLQCWARQSKKPKAIDALRSAVDFGHRSSIAGRRSPVFDRSQSVFALS